MAEATGSHRRLRRKLEVETEDAEKERELEASEGLFHDKETAQGEEKRPWGRAAEPTAAAIVASSIAAVGGN